MTNIELNGGQPIYQVFYNGSQVKNIRYEGVNYAPSNQDKVVVKDFLNSTGTYIQLRVVQITPQTEEKIYDSSREIENRLLLFAGRPLLPIKRVYYSNSSEDYEWWIEENILNVLIDDSVQSTVLANDYKDTYIFSGSGSYIGLKIEYDYTKPLQDFTYIGSIQVDKDFKLETIQQIIDSVDSLEEYFEEDFDNIFILSYKNLGDTKEGKRYFQKDCFGDIHKPLEEKNDNLVLKESEKPVGIITCNPNKEFYQVNNNMEQYLTELDGELYYGYKDDGNNYQIYNINDITDTKILSDGIKLKNNTYYLKQRENREGVFEFYIADNRLCLRDIDIQKSNSINKDQWSVLYLPYWANEQLEVLVCAILKDVSNIIDKNSYPSLQLLTNRQSGQYDSLLSLYDTEIMANGFVAAKSTINNFPVLENFGTMDGITVYLNNKNRLVGDFSDYEEENIEDNLYTWPLNNNAENYELSIEKCYFSFDGQNWCKPIKKKKVATLNNTTEKDVEYGVIDINLLARMKAGEDLEIYYKKETSFPKKKIASLKICDKNSSTFDNNGNFLLVSKNILNILIINNKITNLKEETENILEEANIGLYLDIYV